MDRRSFIRNTSVAAGGLALGTTFWSQLYSLAGAAETIKKVNPYGPLGAPDANSIRLPAGFTSRVVATTGVAVQGTAHVWHHSPDGGACFKVPGGGGAYVYVSNCEVAAGGGGVGAIKFGGAGGIQDAYSILSGTDRNCAGGPTPWGTWLSAEEVADGHVWECNPFAPGNGTEHPSMGAYNHEAAAVDPVRKHVYLTEDQPDGRFYRFIPAAYPDLHSGKLQVARWVRNGATVALATDAKVGKLEWVTVANGAVGVLKPRPANTTAFNGGEGIWYDEGYVYFTTKGDGRVYRLKTDTQVITLLYDDAMIEGAPLTNVDNVTISRGNEILVAEDGGNMEINIIRLGNNRTVGPLLRIEGQPTSEITGPAFSPKGDRLYFSSQRASGVDGIGGLGKTYEVKGPFRGAL